MLPVITGVEIGKRNPYLVIPDLAKLAIETLVRIGPDAKDSLHVLGDVVELAAEPDLTAENESDSNLRSGPIEVVGRDGTKMTEVIELAKKAIIRIGGHSVSEGTIESGVLHQSTLANQ